MNSFDLAIFHFLNSFAQRNYTFDLLIVHGAQNGLTTGAVIVALFWAAWEIEGKANPEKREILLFGMFASMFSVFAARFLALTLPFRLRPLHNPDIGYRLPFGMKPEILINWSSFPSDHATIFMCLAVILWLVSRRLGMIAILYTAFVIDLPRIYAGIHYPTDILGGSLLGLGIASLALLPKLRTAVASPVVNWKQGHPLLFHCLFFLCAFEIGELFATVRDFGKFALQAVQAASKFSH
jgi:undecaprenyl-diphosphatase